MTNPTYRDEQVLVSYLIQELERRLAGRDQPVLWRTAPGDICHLGVLSPGGPSRGTASATTTSMGDMAAEEEPIDSTQEPHSALSPTDVADSTDPIESGTEGDGEPPNAEVSRSRSRSPSLAPDSTARRGVSALGLQILVQPDMGHITLRIRPRFAVYTRHFVSWAIQRQELGEFADVAEAVSVPRIGLVDCAVRHAVRPATTVVHIDSASLPARWDDGGCVQAALDAVLADAAADADRPLWRPSSQLGTIPRAELATKDTYHTFLSRIPAAAPSLLLRADLDIRARATPEGLVLVQAYLRNTTPSDSIGDPFNLLIDAALEVSVYQGTLVPIELVPIPDDYQVDRAVWALGHASSVAVSANRRVVRTVALAQVAQPRITSRDDPPASLADLAAAPLSVLGQLADAMRRYQRTWAGEVSAWIAAGSGSRDPVGWSQERTARERDLADFDAEVARFEEGIELLRTNPLLRQAFQAMHRVMLRAGAGRYDRWRRFQVVFLVSQLPALAARTSPLRTVRSGLDRADVLWFPTGGGKTEAYLGLIACAALYDRLRGKDGGVTAWLRFPLRMLSVQQVQRAAAVIWEAEQERQALSAALGKPLGDPIALGYLVGKELTPNALRAGDPQWPLEQIAHDPTLREKVHLVRHCPACRGTGTVTVDIDVTLARIHLRCTGCNAVLPIYVSDSEVLRFLPALVIGTVDKLASVAYRAALAMLWAGPVWCCPEAGHGYGVGRWCGVPNCPTNPTGSRSPRKRPAMHLHDPAPALIVQDELHLIEQELGAFAGHYETLVRAEAVHHSGLPPKVLAATATIAGFGHQARQLYGVRDAVRFPGRDRQRDETCYTTVRHDPLGQPQLARILIGFQPPHLTPVDAAILCATTLHAIIASLHQNPYATIAAVGLRDARTAEDVRALLHCYDTTVTYVGTKASGTRITEALEQTSSGKTSSGGTSELAVRLLTGGTPFGEIAATIDDLEQAPPWAHPDHLDAVVATSVISHGVDIARLNLMVLDAIPDMAEYIQASSRVGRRHLGLVVAVLPRTGLRATSLYHRWREIHRHLDQLITPVPINRFARAALARTFPGVMLSALFSRALPHAGVVDLDTVYALSGPLHAATDVAAITTLAEAAYGLGSGLYPPSLEEQARQQITEQAALFAAALARLRSTGGRYLREAFSPAPMSSLRDVDVSLGFDLSPTVSERDLRWFTRNGPGSEEEG